MLASMHNRRIGGEAADLYLRGSREGPQKTGHSHSELDGERSASRLCGTSRGKDMLVSPQMDAASAGSQRQRHPGHDAVA